MPDGGTAGPVGFAVLVGGAQHSPPRRLLAVGERCPGVRAMHRHHAPQAAPALDVEVLAEGSRTQADINLRLTDARADTCTCTAVFLWALGPSTGPADPSPTLVVSATMTAGGEFSVLRKAIEVR